MLFLIFSFHICLVEMHKLPAIHSVTNELKICNSHLKSLEKPFQWNPLRLVSLCTDYDSFNRHTGSILYSQSSLQKYCLTFQPHSALRHFSLDNSTNSILPHQFRDSNKEHSVGIWAAVKYTQQQSVSQGKCSQPRVVCQQDTVSAGEHISLPSLKWHETWLLVTHSWRTFKINGVDLKEFVQARIVLSKLWLDEQGGRAIFIFPICQEKLHWQKKQNSLPPFLSTFPALGHVLSVFERTAENDNTVFISCLIFMNSKHSN